MIKKKSNQHLTRSIIRPFVAGVLPFLSLGLMSGLTIGMSIQSAYADGGAPDPINYSARYKKAESLVYKEKYSAAIKILNTVTKGDKNNADAWNLQGFALRKTDKLEEAQEAYLNALKIDPDHKGALEYQGELFIKLGDIDAAKGNLEKLNTLCPDGCEEKNLLQAALNNT